MSGNVTECKGRDLQIYLSNSSATSKAAISHCILPFLPGAFHTWQVKLASQGPVHYTLAVKGRCEGLPVEAQPTAWTASGLMERRRLTWETSAVMPRSLKEPVWLMPQFFTHMSDMPSWRPKPSAQNRLLLPSNMLLM